VCRQESENHAEAAVYSSALADPENSVAAQLPVEKDVQSIVVRVMDERERQSRLSDPFVLLVRDKSLEDIVRPQGGRGFSDSEIGGVRGNGAGKKKRGKQMLSLQEFHSIGSVEVTPRLISDDEVFD
jgi:hypothetical protein